MKLDTKALRYLTNEDWRVLTGVEIGSRNHEIVPTPLIVQLSGLRGSSGVQKSISNLAKVNLIARVKNAKYDGYRLTYGGLDYLALHTHQKKSVVYSVGNQIGVGKESDIFVVASSSGTQYVIKIHRLGRISFRTVKANRDYLRNRHSGSWMYMSRLAAMKEFAFMQALKNSGFSVPEPISQNRHTIVMSLIDGFPLRQIKEVPDSAMLYGELIEMIMRLASFGLIHGDFNEFNILITEVREAKDSISHDDAVQSKQNLSADSKEESIVESPITLVPVLIDFPQMVSIDHPNAASYFDRDVNCIKRFFERRFHFVSEEAGPFLADARKLVGARRLDVEVEASGFSKKMAKELEGYMLEVGVDGDHGKESGDRSGAEDDSEKDEAIDTSDEDEERDDETDYLGIEGESAENKSREPELAAMRPLRS